MATMKAAFFDRDGTINVNYGHVYKPEDLDFVHGIPEVIRSYNEQKIPVIVVTNQAGIAKGKYTLEDMYRFNAHLNAELINRYGAHIDAVYYCPHHPDYTGECECRKPKPGMFLQASKDLGISLADSIMYGDKESDRQAALAAGITRFVLVEDERNL